MSFPIEKTYTSSAAMLHPGGPPLPLLPTLAPVNPPPSPLLLVVVPDGFPPCPLGADAPPLPPVPALLVNVLYVGLALHPRAAAMNSEDNVMARTGTS